MAGSRANVTPAESEALVLAAWEAGARNIDTVPFYSNSIGAAERHVGDALREQARNEWVRSTKVG